MYGPTKDLKTSEKVMIRIIHMSMNAERESSGFQRKSVLRRSGIEGIVIAGSAVPRGTIQRLLAVEARCVVGCGYKTVM